MRLVVDMQGAQSSESRYRGIGRYSLSLVKELARQARQHEMILVLNAAFPEGVDWVRDAFADLLPPENLRLFDVAGPVAGAKEKNAARRQAAERVREIFLAGLRPDMVLVTSLFEGLADEAVTSIGVTGAVMAPTAVVLYDLIPYVLQERYLVHPTTRTWYMGKLDQLRRADLLLPISRYSAREARERLGFSARATVNIKTACDPLFRPLSEDGGARLAHLAATYGLDRPFVMYTGGIDPRKNIEGLIEAYAGLPGTLRRERQLAVVCAVREADRHRLERLAQAHGLAPGELVLTGFVPEEDLLFLYNACEVFVFPSVYEGFGLPALEAMACGRPVIAANRTSLPEVVGNPAALFDPEDVADMTASLQRALADTAFRTVLARRGLAQAARFSWPRTAAMAWRAMERAMRETGRDRPHLRSAPPRPLLAYVSPLPPQQSGISEYSARLLPELSRHYAIEVVAEAEARPGPEITSCCVVRDLDWFRRHGAGRYDRVLYHFGNSRFHAHMFELLAQIPGVVVLHDFFLSDLIAYNDLVRRKDRHGLARALYHAHGWPALIALARANKSQRELTERFPANLEVIQDALGVIVHSEYARQLARHWYGSRGLHRFRAVPLAWAADPGLERRTARASLGLDPDVKLVCSFGHVSQTKCSLDLARAWLKAPVSRDPRCRLVFVGQAPEGSYGRAFREIVQAPGVAGRVLVTGWLERSVYRQWLGAADLAVQLRTHSRGETSAAVLDCLGQGLATVVNRHGSLAELPQDAVLALDDAFTEVQLIEGITVLLGDPASRRRLGRQARAHIRAVHNPRACATAYREATEAFYSGAKVRETVLRASLEKADPPLSARDRKGLADAVARTFPPEPRRPQLLVDVSELARSDFRTGVQRVVRALLKEFLLYPPWGWAVEPVWAEADRPGYRYARRFASRFLQLSEEWAGDDPVTVWPGDVFFGLDLPRQVVCAQQETLHAMRRRGAKLFFMIYDLLPIDLPEDFPDTEKALHEFWLEVVGQGDGAICISQAVSDRLTAWFRERWPTAPRGFRVHWCHLGADIEGTLPSLGLPAKAEQILAQIRARPSWLMVGTLEPRKGHVQALAAVERLWAAGEDVNLVLVGRQRRTLRDFATGLSRHPEWNKRLFWPHPVSDEYLKALYAASAGLLEASRGEGFGLPLIEAARHGLPVIARDIPVFREVAGGHAFYFPDDTSAVTLSEALSRWLALYRQGRAPSPGGMPQCTWKQCAESVLENLCGRQTVLNRK